jgi:type II secretory pathway pseudopilin PulG
MKLKFFKKKQKGFTLVEILLVVGFISLASIAIYEVFNAASTTSKARDEMWQLEELANKIKANYSVVADYTGVTQATVLANNYAPVKMINGGALTNSFGGNVLITPSTIGGGTANNSFMITSTIVPGNVCPKLVSLGSQYFHMVRINGMIIKDVNTLQISPTNLAAWCNADTVTLDFFGM